jgi:hypothetical protein
MTGNKTLKEAVRTRALSLGETVKVLKAACRTYYDQHGFPGGAESEELLELLVSGNLRFGSAECGDPAKDGTADAGEAERLAAALSRRSQLYMVRAALHVFAGYAYDLSCSRRGALYYPGLQLYACIGLLQTCEAEISAGFEDASRADMSVVIAITRILFDFNIRRIRLADTVGVMLPGTCREIVEAFFAYVGKEMQLGFHAHNDFGMALANTVEMLKSGCLWADTSLCGIGERAGNCDFYSLIRLANQLFDFGITPEAAAAAQRAFADILRGQQGF